MIEEKKHHWVYLRAMDLGLTARTYAWKTGLAEPTARKHFKGRVPPTKQWGLVSEALDLTKDEVSFRYKNQLSDEGRIRGCCVCSKEIVIWRNNVLCDSKLCLREYDRNRKKLRRQKVKILNSETKKSFGSMFLSSTKARKDLTKFPKPIEREELNLAVNRFLETGGVIEKLNVTAIAEGADLVSRDLYTNSEPFSFKVDLTNLR